jgi:hypothetical protein
MPRLAYARLRVFAVAAVLVVVGCFQDVHAEGSSTRWPTAPPVSVAHLRGLVLTQVTFQPVAGARIEVEGNVSYSDAAGNYVVQNLRTGIVPMTLSRTAYDTLRTQLQLNGGDQVFTFLMKSNPAVSLQDTP